MESLTVSDGIPKWLQSLYLSLDDEKSSSTEKAMVSTLIVIMYETGFFLENHQINGTGTFDVSVMRGLPSAVGLASEQGSYKFNFTHFMASRVVTLVVIPLDFALIVNLIVKNEKVVSLALNWKDYASAKPSNVPLVHIDRLSSLFKEKIFAVKPLVVDEAFNPHHILHLPNEILAFILKHLSPRDFCNFGATCSKASSFLEDDKIWKIICKSNYPGLHLSGNDTWKDLVKYTVKKEKESKKVNIRFHTYSPFAVMGPLI